MVWQMQKMEDYMTDLTHDMTDKMPRRSFFGRFTGAMVLGIAGFATTPVRANRRQRHPTGRTGREC